MFIIYYGYNYEDPEKVYAIDYKKFKIGKDMGIMRRHDDGQLRSVTYRSHTNDKHEQEITDEEEEVKTEPDRQSNYNMIKRSPVKSIKTKLDAQFVEEDPPKTKSMGKINTNTSNALEIKKGSQRLAKNKVKPISVEKSKLIPEEDSSKTQSEVEDEVPPLPKTFEVAPKKEVKITETSNTVTVLPSTNHKIEQSHTHVIQSSS